MCVCTRVHACARECACVFVTSDNYFKMLWSNILSAGNMTSNFAQKYLRNFVSLMKQKATLGPFHYADRAIRTGQHLFRIAFHSVTT